MVAAVVALPLAAERSVETAAFRDRVGTFPVEVTLAHDGTSTLDTGVLGKVYWDQTGAAGFGVRLRSTGPPVAGGTLSSYAAPRFLRANAAFVEDPSELADVYAQRLRTEVLDGLVRYELLAALAGGLVLCLLFRGRAPPVVHTFRTPPARVAVHAVYLLLAVGISAAVAWQFFGSWVGSREVTNSYALPSEPRLSFSSPQTREVAQQIQPFIEKNTRRIEERTRQFADTADANLAAELPLHAAALQPREGERIVISEADPQGSIVATTVRRDLYPLLQELLGEEAIVLRTIAGDLTSNGTVAEGDFAADEVHASTGIPTVVVKGDHDTSTTVAQLHGEGVTVPDLEVEEVGGLQVAGAADPAFKALFGGLVRNPSGVTEEELGESLRDVVDKDAGASGVVVVLHQPRAAAAYLGLGSTGDLATAVGSETTPRDDGIPDVPPGMVNIGHLHDASRPWVIWNTDGDEITWTVVSQLGTSGGVEENPTFNRFSTPFSVPLKDISVRLAYVNPRTGLQTGYASIVIAPDGSATVEDRVDVGLPGGEPLERAPDS
ncbi:MAG TPA: hypothetical protein DEQ43_20245 [Nocardioides bacterium]|nr:hypothetical protein [Nocardioides sp.]